MYSKALTKCQEPLLFALKEDFQFVADSLCEYNIALQGELEDMSGTKMDKARLILKAVKNEVKHDHRFFEKFVKILQGKYHFHDIVTMLQEYLEQGK